MDDGDGRALTLNGLIDTSCTMFENSPAMGMAMEKHISYAELSQRILALATRMQEEGVEKGDHVAIIGENSHNWGIAYLAVVRLGAIGVPILPDLPEADVLHILHEMKVKIIFLTQRQIDKVYELKLELVAPFITLDDYMSNAGLAETVRFSDYLAEATALREELLQKREVTFSEVGEDDLASIIYTSGTSGFSKAVMLSHKNLLSNAYSALNLAAPLPGDVFLSILPLPHTYEFTCGFVLPLLKGCRITYAGKSPTPAILQKICQYEKPLVIFAVPLVLEKIYKKRVLPQIEQSTALSLMCKFSYGRKIIYKRIGQKLEEFFGGKLQFMGIGGAALNPEVEEFLSAAKFPYLIGYGMTEASLLAGGPLGDKNITMGSTGKPIPNVKIKIMDPDPDTGIGEIYGSGPNIMQGYYNDEEGTREVVTDDGWLATGDLGFIDDQGNLHISGRVKNIIVMANGENIYPEPIEHKMNAYGWVVEGLVVENNGRLDAWVYPDYEYIDDKTMNQSRVQRHEFIEALLEKMRKEINLQVSPKSRITKIFERREPFIKTATHKIKRYLYDGHAMAN
jgi:long-chain acyl-CoA synthetase